MALLEWGTQEKVLTQRDEERGWRRSVRGLRGQVRGCLLWLWVGAVTVDRGIAWRAGLGHCRRGSGPSWVCSLERRGRGWSDPVPQPKGQRVGSAVQAAGGSGINLGQLERETG